MMKGLALLDGEDLFEARQRKLEKRTQGEIRDTDYMSRCGKQRDKK